LFQEEAALWMWCRRLCLTVSCPPLDKCEKPTLVNLNVLAASVASVRHPIHKEGHLDANGNKCKEHKQGVIADLINLIMHTLPIQNIEKIQNPLQAIFFCL
jgi:hypothetical protein